MGTGYVPYIFQNRTGYLPLSQLDADLEYVSKKVLSVKDPQFGAVGDGVADDTAALQAAFSSGGGTVLIPPGNYRCTAPVTIADASGLTIVGAGSYSIIRFAPGINGLSLTYSDVRFPPMLSDFSVMTEQPGPAVAGTGLTITGPSGVLTTYKIGVIVNNVTVRGFTPTSMGWLNHIKCVSLWYPIFQNCNLKGYSAVGAGLNNYESLKGIWFTDVGGFGGAMVPIVNNLVVQHINDGVYEDSSNLGFEGYVFDNCQMVGVRNGINIGNGIGTITPGGTISNSNFDASFRGVVLNWRVQSTIADCLFYRTAATTEAWIGILAAANSGNNQFHDNIFENISANVSSCNGLWITDSSDNVVGDLTADNFNAAGGVVVLEGTASRNKINASSFVSGPHGTLLSNVVLGAGLTGTGNRITDNTRAPRTVTGGAATLTELDQAVIANFAGICTLTLLDPTKYTGMEVMVKTITANTVVSASANVSPRIGGAAGTAILAAAAGNWAKLKSDGTTWVLMEGTP